MLILCFLFSLSPAKSSLASLAVPGAGDFLNGKQKRGAAFLSVEIATWFSYFGFRCYQDRLNNSALNYASLKASANIEGKDSRYFDALEDYSSSFQYNQFIREEARRIYPDTTDKEVIKKRKEYIREHVYEGEDSWEWDSYLDSRKYDDLRDESRSFAIKAANMVGVAVANRIVSFFVSYLTTDDISVEIEKNAIQVGVKF